ncbi:MAG: hypothetical protein H6Q84_2529 [Deltaproteobacteria bacterium]|nr:hypothetical protein [Deltaproteobacteria bacterium]
MSFIEKMGKSSDRKYASFANAVLSVFGMEAPGAVIFPAGSGDYPRTPPAVLSCRCVFSSPAGRRRWRG